MIAAAGAAMADRPDPYTVLRIDDEPALSRPGTSLSSAATLTSMPQVPETALPDSSSYSATTRRVGVERMQGAKGRRDHSHHQSNPSRHHKDDQKTVGEYALHVLFTSVRPAQTIRSVLPLY